MVARHGQKYAFGAIPALLLLQHRELQRQRLKSLQ